MAFWNTEFKKLYIQFHSDHITKGILIHKALFPINFMWLPRQLTCCPLCPHGGRGSRLAWYIKDNNYDDEDRAGDEEDDDNDDDDDDDEEEDDNDDD